MDNRMHKDKAAMQFSGAPAFQPKFTHVDREIFKRGALAENVRDTRLPKITVANTLKLTKRLLSYRLFIASAKERLQYTAAVLFAMGIYIKISENPSLALQLNDAFYNLAVLYSLEAKVPKDTVKSATLGQLVAYTKSMSELGAWKSRSEVKEDFRKLYDRMNVLGNREKVDPFSQAKIESKIKPTWSALANTALISASIEFISELGASLGLARGEKVSIKQLQDAKGTPYYELWKRGLITALEDAGAIMRVNRDIANMTKEDFRAEIPAAMKENGISYIQELTALKGANYVGRAFVTLGLEPSDFGLIDKNAKPKVEAETRTSILPASNATRTEALAFSPSVSISDGVMQLHSQQSKEDGEQGRTNMNWKSMKDSDVMDFALNVMSVNGIRSLNQLRYSNIQISLPDR